MLNTTDRQWGQQEVVSQNNQISSSTAAVISSLSPDRCCMWVPTALQLDSSFFNVSVPWGFSKSHSITFSNLISPPKALFMQIAEVRYKCSSMPKFESFFHSINICKNTLIFSLTNSFYSLPYRESSHKKKNSSSIEQYSGNKFGTDCITWTSLPFSLRGHFSLNYYIKMIFFP